MMWREWCMKHKVIRLLKKEKKRHAVRRSFNCWKRWILYLSCWTFCPFINFAYSSAKEEHWHKFGHFEWKMIYNVKINLLMLREGGLVAGDLCELPTLLSLDTSHLHTAPWSGQTLQLHFSVRTKDKKYDDDMMNNHCFSFGKIDW